MIADTGCNILCLDSVSEELMDTRMNNMGKMKVGNMIGIVDAGGHRGSIYSIWMSPSSDSALLSVSMSQRNWQTSGCRTLGRWRWQT